MVHEENPQNGAGNMLINMLTIEFELFVQNLRQFSYWANIFPIQLSNQEPLDLDLASSIPKFGATEMCSSTNT